MKFPFWKIIVLSLIIILAGLILYFTHFRFRFSSDSNAWSNFAIFNGYFLSIVNLVILGYISFITFQTTQAYNNLLIKPLVYINLDGPEEIKSSVKDCWYVNNGAKYPALNLIVRYTFLDQNIKKCTKWVLCTSLAESQRLELFWIHWADKIEICYTDLTEAKCYLYEFANYQGKTIEITKEQYFDYQKEALDNKKNNITHIRDLLESYLNEQKRIGINGIAKDKGKFYNENFISKNLMG